MNILIYLRPHNSIIQLIENISDILLALRRLLKPTKVVRHKPIVQQGKMQQKNQGDNIENGSLPATALRSVHFVVPVLIAHSSHLDKNC